MNKLKRLLNYSGWEKEILTTETIMGEWQKMGQDLKETLLQPSKYENDDEKHHQIVETLRND